jgi:anaerobic ribonucleoside-triphosphate reductase activating protein
MAITQPDINNGLGCRVTLWVTGCPNHCPGCHNPETWDKLAGKVFNEKAKSELLELLKKPYIKGLTLSGGEPMDFNDSDKCSVLLDLAKTVKTELPEKDIWVFSGFTLRELLSHPSTSIILDYVDNLVDGRFEQNLADKSLAFRGSKNQKIYHNYTYESITGPDNWVDKTEFY